VFYAVKISRDFTFVCLLIFVTVNGTLLGYVTNSDRTIAALKAALPLSNSTDQILRLQSLISNQSDDIKAIRNSTSAQVQVLTTIAEVFAMSSVFLHSYVHHFICIPFGRDVDYLRIEAYLACT
jgi:hypothetical protein